MAGISKINLNGTTYNLAINYINLVSTEEDYQTMHGDLWTTDINGYNLSFLYDNGMGDYDDMTYENGAIVISLDGGVTQCWFALLDGQDNVYMQAREVIYDNDYLQKNILKDLFIEVFAYDDYLSLLSYIDVEIDIMGIRSNCTPICTIRLDQDLTSWIVEPTQ